MSQTGFGRLERVELRHAWKTEAGDFTPWLAKEENLVLLGEAVGIDLEVEAQEKNVGPFRADLLCKDTASGNWVLVENQLERTDHAHLGQLLTYAAGLKAVTIVWIADRFTDEHRAALDWLNDITDQTFNFFGLQVELWQIGGSPVAPKFNVVCRPNEWSRDVSRGASAVRNQAITPKQQLQLEFWTAFREYALEHALRIKPIKPAPQRWMNLSIGRDGFYLQAIASFYDTERDTYGSHEIRAELVTHGSNSKLFFEHLEGRRAEIERELGETLTWHNPEDKIQCRIYLRKEADLNDRNRWPEYHAWLVEKLDGLHRVFQPIIKNVDVETQAINNFITRRPEGDSNTK